MNCFTKYDQDLSVVPVRYPRSIITKYHQKEANSTPDPLCPLLLKGPNKLLLKERQNISLINWVPRSCLPRWSSHANLWISRDIIIKMLGLLQQPVSQHLPCTSEPGQDAVVKCQIIFSLAVGSNCGCVDSCQLAGVGLAYLPFGVPSGLVSIQASTRALCADTDSRKGLLPEEPRLWFSSPRSDLFEPSFLAAGALHASVRAYWGWSHKEQGVRGTAGPGAAGMALSLMWLHRVALP